MLKISGPQTLSGTVKTSGSKNAALPLLAAGLFFERFTLHNVPKIGDVLTFLSIVESLGVGVQWEGNTVTYDTSKLSITHIDRDKIKKIRVGIFLFPALLDRLGALEIPFPGGCNIGKRPINEHLDAFLAFGFENMGEGENIAFQGKNNSQDLVLRANFAVTATENIIMMAALRSGKTTIELAAIEPHVINLIDFYRSLGVHISIDFKHTIIIEGNPNITRKVASATVISDYIESGTFIVLGALTAEPSIRIEGARIHDLTAFLGKCEDAGVRFDVDKEHDIITVYNSRTSLKPTNIQTNIFPGFPTDLQSPFALMLTQAEGISRIHEVLFEGRLNWLIEAEKMKGHIAIMNPHEAMIFGRTHLKGTTVSSWDLRAGVTMIIAGMIARGDTLITNVEYIERGYEDIVGKISSLGGIIEKVD
ncbi:UDP-N-acetylglucosamine 1-carboxyvinyltransferase [Candidatus Gracilibacteria bacterium]|nr:UDP-N-acetylglucosamine 1-carboxyvinyltransferase [Candidatus Gracilibacteria bacterium]